VGPKASSIRSNLGPTYNPWSGVSDPWCGERGTRPAQRAAWTARRAAAHNL